MSISNLEVTIYVDTKHLSITERRKISAYRHGGCKGSFQHSGIVLRITRDDVYYKQLVAGGIDNLLNLPSGVNALPINKVIVEAQWNGSGLSAGVYDGDRIGHPVRIIVARNGKITIIEKTLRAKRPLESTHTYLKMVLSGKATVV